MRRLLIGALVIMCAACAGKDGAAGPMGPQGPQGPAGPAGPGSTTIVASGIANASGDVVIALPAAVGTNPTQPPHMDCYQTDDPNGGAWLSVASAYTGSNDTYCGAVFSSGIWYAVMSQMVPGWTAAFVVTY